METKSRSTSLITFIHEISGQLRRQNIIEGEHAYAKFWNRHPDPTNKSRPARFLFMQSFNRSTTDEKDQEIKVDCDSSETQFVDNPLVSEVTALTKGQVTITEEFVVTDSAPNKSTWSPLAQRIWAKALNILYTDRLIRLTIEETPNEVVTKKMISQKCANKFRHLFASLTFWDPSILSWLHATLLEHASGQYLVAYHESMQLLRSRFPSLIDRFYVPPVHNDPIRSRYKGPTPDPIQTVLNNYKPKRIKNCPIFILVPNGPQPPSSIIPPRLKQWQLLFAALGRIITLSINYRPTMRVKDCLKEIMIGVRDKINECRTNFTEGRPIILVGFGHSSLIATHVALETACKVTATICLGFPLAGVNGFRGDLDDPLLDTTVPTLFVIGQNATLSSIDDIEDFRERITKTETGLVIVGGANDHLVVSETKLRFTGITQAIVDRCISDEVYDFINFVMNPHFVPSENNYVSAASKNASKNASTSSTTPATGSKEVKSSSKSKSKVKSEKQTLKEITSGVSNITTDVTGKLETIPINDTSDPANSSKEAEMINQSSIGVDAEVIADVSTSVTLYSSIGIDAATNTLNPYCLCCDNGKGTKHEAKPKAKKTRPKPKKKDIVEPKILDITKSEEIKDVTRRDEPTTLIGTCEQGAQTVEESLVVCRLKKDETLTKRELPKMKEEPKVKKEGTKKKDESKKKSELKKKDETKKKEEIKRKDNDPERPDPTKTKKKKLTNEKQSSTSTSTNTNTNINNSSSSSSSSTSGIFQVI